MVLLPNDTMDPYLQVEFLFSTSERNRTPKLKGFSVAFKCGVIK